MVAYRTPPPPPAPAPQPSSCPPAPRCMAQRVLVGSLHEEVGVPCQDVAQSAAPACHISLYAVLDGHGPAGAAVAERAAAKLMTAASDRTMRLTLRDKAAHAAALRAAFTDAAEAVDERADAAESGATASVVLLAPPFVTVANVGDSAVVWARGGKDAVCVTRDHRATDEREKRRVERVGGIVQNDYLSSGDPFGKVIAVTRAFGDLDVRSIGVIAEPDVAQVVFEGADDFLILATDGLWDAHGGISPQRAVDVVRHCLEKGDADEEGGVKAAVDELIDLARGRERLPIDDAAVIVVRVGGTME